MLVNAIDEVVVGFPAMLSFSCESIVDTDIVAVSPSMAVSVEPVMPIPAAMKSPSPPAVEEALKVGITSMLRGVEELIPPPEPSTPDDLHAVVLMLVVLLNAVRCVATRHRARTKKHADIEEMAIIETKTTMSSKSVALPGCEVNIQPRRRWPVRTRRACDGRSAKGSCSITALVRYMRLLPCTYSHTVVLIGKLNASP
jgi:hypothetical protein